MDAFGVKVLDAFGVKASDASELNSRIATSEPTSIMVKKIRGKAAPFLARSQEDDAKRRATVEEADERWKLMESKKPDPPFGAIEEAFISYSPMSEIILLRST